MNTHLRIHNRQPERRQASRHALSPRVTLAKTQHPGENTDSHNDSKQDFSTGKPLDAKLLSIFQPRFRKDFSSVRVHTDEAAGRFAKNAHALAYTIGKDITFADGQYNPDTPEGQNLVAHELAHVVQQSQSADIKSASTKNDRQEHEAHTASYLYRHAATTPIQILERSQMRIAKAPESGPQAGTTQPISPLTLPLEGVEMPWRGNTDKSSELGYLRDTRYFWERFQSLYGDTLSPENRTRISAGRSPIVDATWIAKYPQHAPYTGQRLEHHHIGQGARAVPLPEKLHDAYTVFHPKRTVVGTPSKGVTRPVPPLQTRKQTEKEISRHVKQKRILGKGIGPSNPPAAPKIPVSSQVAGETGTSQATSAPKSTVPASKPPAVSTSATIKSQPNSMTSSGTRTSPQIGSPLKPIAPHGFSSRGVAKGNALTLVFQGLNFVFNSISDDLQAERLEASFSNIAPTIESSRQEHPELGILVIVYFDQARAHPDSVIVPSPIFSHIEIATGVTRDEARLKHASTPAIREISTNSRLVSSQEHWIPPLRPSGPARLTSPFKFTGKYGTFVTGKAVLQDVSWGGVSGFDDEGMTELNPDQGQEVKFRILMPPPKIYFFNGGHLVTVTVDIVPAGALGGGIKAVDLDPWLPTTTSGVPVFPQNAYTNKLFSRAPRTRDNLGQLRSFANVEMMRWVNPENITVLNEG